MSVTCFMFAGAADANRSAGAPWFSCWARPELPPKLKVTFEPGLAASKSLPSRVNVSFSEAAAKTVTSPSGVAAEPDSAGAGASDGVQPVSASAAADRADRTRRRGRVLTGLRPPGSRRRRGST
ncbi:hypothetical protein GCM10010428_65590 [Actinosynnema pretiosum subsp. pretiosum]